MVSLHRCCMMHVLANVGLVVKNLCPDMVSLSIVVQVAWSQLWSTTQDRTGLTAPMAGQTAWDLTAPELCRTLAFRQTLNTIANCYIILRSCTYPHDIHNLPLDEYIGKISENVCEGFETSLLVVFAQRHNLIHKQEKAMNMTKLASE